MEQIVFLISVQYKPFFNTHDFKLPLDCLMKCVVFVEVDLVSHVPQLSQNITRVLPANARSTVQFMTTAPPLTKFKYIFYRYLSLL